MPKKRLASLDGKDVDQFELINPLMRKIYTDIQELTKKKQDGVLSKTRIVMVNRLLENARLLLKEEPSIAYLDRLDEDAIPQNADAMMIIGQYVAALQAFQDRHTAGDSFDDKYWITSDGPRQRKVI